MLIVFIIIYNIMFLSYFLLEITNPVQETRSIRKAPSTKKVIHNVANSLKITHYDGDEKTVAKLVKKKLDELYRK